MKKRLIITLTGFIAAGIVAVTGLMNPVVARAAEGEVKFYEDCGSYNFWKIRQSSGYAGQTENVVWNTQNNVEFNEGLMSLKLDKNGNGYSGGEVFTTEKFGFGTYKVNMKAIRNDGVISSFFTYFKEGDRGTEIDIEFLGYDTTKVQFNYFTNGVGQHEYLYDLGFDASKEFHTYSFKWNKSYIKWYVDGKLAYTATEDIPQYEAAIAMDVWPTVDEYWAGKYDGKTPLYAYYDWFSYTALGSVDETDSKKTEEAKTTGLKGKNPGDTKKSKAKGNNKSSGKTDTTDLNEKEPDSESVNTEAPVADAPVEVAPKTVIIDDITYDIDESGLATVTKIGPEKKVSFDTITVDEKTYPVVAIANNACKNNKKLKKVTIGSNVTSIGKNAFKGCKNLKKITIKAGGPIKIGKNAFKKINDDAKIKIKGVNGKTKKKLIKAVKKQTNAVVY